MVDDDYTEEDRWDWDRSDMAQRCKHGTFIGSSWGPDLMCGACEMGDADITVNEVLKHKESYEKKINEALKAYGTLYSFAKLPATKMIMVDLIKALNNETMAEQKLYDEQIAEIREWAESDDDDNWLSRKHDADMKEYYARRESR